MLLSKPIAQPKGRTRKSLKAKRDRDEAKVKRATRAACVERDGACRLAGAWCLGRSEMCHLPPRTRAATRNMPPEYRHDPNFVAMLCSWHHDRLDGRIGPSLVIKTPLESK